MLGDDAKLIRRMTPLLQRVLIVDPAPASARLLGDLLRDLVGAQSFVAPNNVRGIGAARQINPQIIFVELAGPEVDGIAFAKEIRNSIYPCRQAPIIVMTATATAGAIAAARDAGVHEFLRKPYTTKDILRRLEAVTLRPRDWIEAVNYIGPDRRRFNSGDYAGPLKRKSDAKTPDAAKIQQALRIIRSALSVESGDPAQVLRSLRAQAADLEQMAGAVSDAKLAVAAANFRGYLDRATSQGGLQAEEAFRQAGPLLAMLPKDAAPAERKSA